MRRYNSSTLWRLYQIGGPDMALRYAEIASSRPAARESSEYAVGSDLEIVDLRFFTGGSTKPEVAERVYGALFPTGATQYVYYQLDLRSPWRHSAIRYTTTARYYNSAGSLLSEITDEFETQPSAPLFSRARGCGKEELRNWTPGEYRVEIDIDYKHVRTAEFTIFEDAPPKAAPKWRPALDFSPLAPPRNPLALGLDGWLGKFKTEFGNPVEREIFDPRAPMDDLAKMRRLMAIDRRYLSATMSARPGGTTEATVRELTEIARDYEQLLEAGAPKRFFKATDLRGKIANATSAAAQANSDLRQYVEAARLYRAAAAAYRAAGKPAEAKRCQERVKEMKYPQDGDLNSEILRLRAKLAKAGANSVDQADALIELGSVYSSNGDDYEARQLLEKAETILKSHAADPSGADLAKSLSASLLGIGAGQPPARGGIEDTLRVQGLYRTLYVALARAYQTSHPKKAAAYRAKAAQHDSRELNDDFSQAMLRMLAGDLGEKL